MNHVLNNSYTSYSLIQQIMLYKWCDGVLTSPLGIPDMLGTKLGPPLGRTLGIAVGQSDTDG